MTTSDGNLPVGETVDIEAALQEVTADDAPETASAEPVADEAAEAPAAPEAAAKKSSMPLIIGGGIAVAGIAIAAALFDRGRVRAYLELSSL